jgi:hypothetical protein
MTDLTEQAEAELNRSIQQTLSWGFFTIIVITWASWALICRAAVRGKLGRNVFIGIHFVVTLQSDAGWVAGHAAALRHVKLFALTVLPVAVGVMFFVPVNPLISAVIEGILLGITAVWTWIAAAFAHEAAWELKV